MAPATLGEYMANDNLTLAFPEPAQERILARQTGLFGAIARFEEWMTHPDSPVRAIKKQEARAGEFAAFPEALAPALGKALVARGVTQLYSHQEEAFTHSAAGKNVVVVTPTASGKTLCYNLPVMDGLMRDPHARAADLRPAPWSGTSTAREHADRASTRPSPAGCNTASCRWPSA